MAWLFKFFFKYPSLVFEQGDFTFAASRSMMLGLAAIGALGLAALVTYRGVTTDGPARDRTVLVVLRIALIAVVMFCLFRPSLHLPPSSHQDRQTGRPEYLLS